MIQHAFQTFSHALEGAPWIGLAAAFAWGVLSVLLSPCHLGSIPLIVAFIDQQGRISTRRAFLISTLFSTGIVVTIAVVGLVTAAAGRLLGDVGPIVNYFVAGLFFLIGSHLLGVIPMPWSGPGQVAMKRRGLLAAFLLGLIFGIAIGPCTFAFLAPVIGVSLKVAGTAPAYAVLLLLVYSLGHCSVIIAAGTGAGLVQTYLSWSESSKATSIVKALCGIGLIGCGLYLIYAAV